jgi:hypothetical protein
MARQPDAHKQTDAVDVAVVIAAYQAEPFLAECVASVLASVARVLPPRHRRRRVDGRHTADCAVVY